VLWTGHSRDQHQQDAPTCSRSSRIPRRVLSCYLLLVPVIQQFASISSHISSPICVYRSYLYFNQLYSPLSIRPLVRSESLPSLATAVPDPGLSDIPSPTYITPCLLPFFRSLLYQSPILHRIICAPLPTLSARSFLIQMSMPPSRSQNNQTKTLPSHHTHHYIYPVAIAPQLSYFHCKRAHCAQTPAIPVH
jgi:hypothetical protein